MQHSFKNWLLKDRGAAYQERIFDQSGSCRRAFESPGKGIPQLEPRRTMLFYTPAGKWFPCNVFMKRHYQRLIFFCYRWGICHGVSTFIVDYTMPFGLLALETLCRVREMGECFVFLGLQGYALDQRRSYRLRPEPLSELERLYSQCDYRFYDDDPSYAAHKVYPFAGLHCTENGLMAMKFHLSKDLLEAWKV